MIELVIVQSGTPPKRITLSPGTYGLGRGDTNDIVLDDKEVSRLHAQLLLDDDTVVVRDLGSGNGTFVAGRAVRSAVVSIGSEIEISPFVLTLERASKPTYSAWMEGIEGPAEGRTFPMAGKALSVGRHEDQDVRLDDAGVSRSHAMLVLRDGVWSVRDNGSANGLYLNGQRLKEAVLGTGDILRIGNSRLRFLVREEEEEIDLEDDPKTVVNRAPLLLDDPAPFQQSPNQPLEASGSDANAAVAVVVAVLVAMTGLVLLYAANVQ
jgi:pSer/pThr/pTyr-binding forkhead associated (FHA) protein